MSDEYMMYPLKDFNELSKSNQNLVREAENDIEKQFQVGKFLIEGKHDFPLNLKLGLQYIEHSVNLKCSNAIIYYINLLIKGEVIPEDLSKASEYLSQLNTTDDSCKFLLQGLISHKKNSFKEALEFFEEGILSFKVFNKEFANSKEIAANSSISMLVTNPLTNEMTS